MQRAVQKGQPEHPCSTQQQDSRVCSCSCSMTQELNGGAASQIQAPVPALLGLYPPHSLLLEQRVAVRNAWPQDTARLALSSCAQQASAFQPCRASERCALQGCRLIFMISHAKKHPFKGGQPWAAPFITDWHVPHLANKQHKQSGSRALGHKRAKGWRCVCTCLRCSPTHQQQHT